MLKCNSCPRECNVDRNEKLGYCGVGSNIRLARADLHFGEEPFISGTRGSGTVFFSGCNLKCVFCQNHDISHGCFGKEVSNIKFIEVIKTLENKGSHNINLVTPTHYFQQIENILSVYKPNIPIIYNSSGYEKKENIQKNLFDVYLFDLKFLSDDKAQKYCGAADYFKYASNAIMTAVNLVGKPQYNEEGIMTKGVVVRHLILPQSTNDSIRIINWLNDNSPEIVLSLMAQYTPLHKANEYKELNRTITTREYEKVLNHCYDCNFSDIYIQEKASATTEYIPKFDLTGIL